MKKTSKKGLSLAKKTVLLFNAHSRGNAGWHTTNGTIGTVGTTHSTTVGTCAFGQE